MKIDASKESATLNISGSYTAAQLEELMRKLAELRSELTPAVPKSRSELDTNVGILVEEEAGLNIALRTNGGFRLWMRNRGYGWIAYEIDRQTAFGVQSYLSTRVGKGIDLIGDGNTNRH